MLNIFRIAVIALVTVLGLGGCAESSRPEATGKGNLRAINAIATSPDIRFLVEARSQGDMNYKGTVARRIDNLSYAVNFETVLAGDTTSTRIARARVDVAANTEYLFALTGNLASPNLLTLEYPERQWSGNESVFEGRTLHLATTEGDLDVYFAAPGTAPVLGAARATIAYGELSAPFEAAAGDHVLTLTSRNDPGDVRYQSRTLTQVGATTVLFAVFDSDPSITGDLSVRLIGSGSQGAELVDTRFPPTLRLMHAAFATGNIDFYADDDFSRALVTDLGFNEISVPFDTGTALTPYTVTPTGMPGVFLEESSLTTPAGTRNSAFFVGKPADLRLIAFNDDHRPIETVGRFRIMQLAANVPLVDLYIYLPSQDIEDVLPRYFSLPFLATTGYAALNAGTYQVAITLPNEKDIIGGPFSLDLALGDVTELAILDTVDPNAFDVVVYDN